MRQQRRAVQACFALHTNMVSIELKLMPKAAEACCLQASARARRVAAATVSYKQGVEVGHQSARAHPLSVLEPEVVWRAAQRGVLQLHNGLDLGGGNSGQRRQVYGR